MSQDLNLLALAVWARRLSTLLNAGVPLHRCLHLLQETSEEPLGSITRQMADQIQAGGMLSGAMSGYLEVFGRLGLSLCRAGEVGGVLDETFAVWADWLECDLEFRGRLDTYYLLAQVGRRPLSRDEYDARLRATVSDLNERARETTWCRVLGMMLDSGVPIIQALEVATREVYPKDADSWVSTLHQAVRAGSSLTDALRQFGFSPFTVQLVGVGEECRALERMLEKAARLLERELDTRLSAALAAMIAAP